MKRLVALTVALASQAVATFAGEPVVSSKQVIAPPPPPPPPEFFRPNEFDIGAFATYATGVGSGDAGKLHAWGVAWISRIGETILLRSDQVLHCLRRILEASEKCIFALRS
jgi:hypothetical protein